MRIASTTAPIPRPARDRARRPARWSVGAALLGLGVAAQPPLEADPTLAPLDGGAPIPVYIAAGAADSAFEPHDPDLARWALDSWAAAVSNRLEFQLTADESQALVRVFFVPAGAGQYGEMRGFRLGGRRGAAVFIRPDTTAFGGRISRSAADDPLFRDTIVYLTCVHELGHALGLTHTANYEDIMYAFGYGGDIHRYFSRYRERLATRADIAHTSALSAGDRAQLGALYVDSPAEP